MTLAACVLLASPAGANPKVVPMDAELALDIQGIGVFRFPGSGMVTVSGQRVLVPAGLVALTSPVTVPVTAATGFHSLVFFRLSNGAASFSPKGVAIQAPGEVCPGRGNHPLGFACNAGKGLGGVMALTTSTFHVVVVPRVVTVFARLPSLGEGGSTNLPFDMDFGAWSTGDARIGSSAGTQTFTGGGQGPLTLISPTFVDAVGLRFPILASFTLREPPPPGCGQGATGEPSSSLLVGVGVAGLFLLRRRPR